MYERRCKYTNTYTYLRRFMVMCRVRLWTATPLHTSRCTHTPNTHAAYPHHKRNTHAWSTHKHTCIHAHSHTHTTITAKHSRRQLPHHHTHNTTQHNITYRLRFEYTHRHTHTHTYTLTWHHNITQLCHSPKTQIQHNSAPTCSYRLRFRYTAVNGSRDLGVHYSNWSQNLRWGRR